LRDAVSAAKFRLLSIGDVPFHAERSKLACRSTHPMLTDNDAPLVFMFPGQSSRYPSLVRKLIRQSQANRQIVDAASDILDRNLVKDFDPDNPSMFDRNEDIQIAVFLANYIHAAMLKRSGIMPDLSLGLSLGEYNHIEDIGVLAFDAVLRLVAARGALYDRGPAGAMAAVGPISANDLDAVIARVGASGCLERAVENAPTQHVIAGPRPAVDAALGVLEQEHFVLGELIEEKLPMHTAAFQPVSERFRPLLEGCEWRAAQRPYVPNLTGTVIPDPSPAVLIDHLACQVCGRVRWRQSLEAVLRIWPNAVFIEVGPRAVLYNLLQPRWIPNMKFKTDGAGDDEIAVEAVRAGLADRIVT
jgi:acyl transferase domain-containing protein